MLFYHPVFVFIQSMEVPDDLDNLDFCGWNIPRVPKVRQLMFKSKFLFVTASHRVSHKNVCTEMMPLKKSAKKTLYTLDTFL